MELANKFYYRVNKERSINELCEKFNTREELIVRNNESIPLYEGEVVYIEQNEFITYIVKPMDTLSKIAENYGKTEDEIIATNKLDNNKLFIGQLIKIY